MQNQVEKKTIGTRVKDLLKLIEEMKA